MNTKLQINPSQETDKIVSFLKETFAKQHIENAVIGLSGGVDSATSFALLRKVIDPQHIYAMHLYYDEPVTEHIEALLSNSEIPEENIKILSIREAVEAVVQTTHIEDDEKRKIRIGNIAARMRMIMLFDYAKKHTALVVGTENKSENLLGYFTRFGDQASDIEPIEHLYKTQIYQLAEHLNIPQIVLDAKPTAGLWAGQTDESEYGFTYEEADQVLSLIVDQKHSIDEAIKRGYANSEKIMSWRKKNMFKHEVPYTL